MTKGFIHKNTEGQWEVGFLSDIGENGQALYTTYETYDTWAKALQGMILKQIWEA